MAVEGWLLLAQKALKSAPEAELRFPHLTRSVHSTVNTVRYHSDIQEHHHAILSTNYRNHIIKGGGVIALEGWQLLALETPKLDPEADDCLPRSGGKRPRRSIHTAVPLADARVSSHDPQHQCLQHQDQRWWYCSVVGLVIAGVEAQKPAPEAGGRLPL